MNFAKALLGLALLTGGMGLTVSCTDYQDEIDALDYRVTVLEELVKRINTDLEAMGMIVSAMANGDYITGVRETADGYVINFAQAGPVAIKDGVDGVDGRDGKDAKVPEIDVRQGSDGNWYWVVDGEWLKGGDGEIIRVNGKDGVDGRDGKDAVSPQVRINPDTGQWEISTDDGQSWAATGTSASGRDGKDGRDGVDGKDGNEFFLTVTYEVTGEGEYMTIVTQSGQTFRIPIYKN